MRRAQIYLVMGAVVGLIAVSVSVGAAPGGARRPAVVAGADNVVSLQRTDAGWEGTWYWYVGSTYNATNLTGVTALGLLEAFNDVKDASYLTHARKAADFIQEHLGVGATGQQYHVRTTAPDVIFLHRLSQVTGDSAYATRATLEWNNLTSFWPKAEDLDALFRQINRRSAWDIAFYLEAAQLSGDATWADDAAAILANTTDPFYYGTDTWWYALNVSAAIRALVGSGYWGQYSTDIISLFNSLVGILDTEDGLDGYVQDTAYAVLALKSVGSAAHGYSNNLGRWLARQQEANGGWLEPGDPPREYPESDGEAVRALCTTLGSNITLDGFDFGFHKNSSWVRPPNPGQGPKPFNGD